MVFQLNQYSYKGESRSGIGNLPFTKSIFFFAVRAKLCSTGAFRDSGAGAGAGAGAGLGNF